MSVRKILMTIAVAAAGLLAALVIFQRAGRGSGGATSIEMRGGRIIDGALLSVEPALYLAQSDSFCLLLRGSEIASVGGRKMNEPDPAVTGRVDRVYETLETVLSSGDVEVRSTIRVANDGSRPIDSVDWGIASHEFELLDSYRVLDAFANELPFRIEEDASIHGKRIRVELLRPVLPGEDLRLTTVFIERARVSREGESWVYRLAGDYPEARLVTRTIRLPEGTALESLVPEPLHVQADGAPIVMWRRYFLPGERRSWEIRYSLQGPR